MKWNTRVTNFEPQSTLVATPCGSDCERMRGTTMAPFRHCQRRYGATSTKRAPQIASPVFHFILASTVRERRAALFLFPLTNSLHIAFFSTILSYLFFFDDALQPPVAMKLVTLLWLLSIMPLSLPLSLVFSKNCLSLHLPLLSCTLFVLHVSTSNPPQTFHIFNSGKYTRRRRLSLSRCHAIPDPFFLLPRNIFGVVHFYRSRHGRPQLPLLTSP